MDFYYWVLLADNKIHFSTEIRGSQYFRHKVLSILPMEWSESTLRVVREAPGRVVVEGGERRRHSRAGGSSIGLKSELEAARCLRCGTCLAMIRTQG